MLYGKLYVEPCETCVVIQYAISKCLKSVCLIMHVNLSFLISMVFESTLITSNSSLFFKY